MIRFHKARLLLVATLLVSPAAVAQEIVLDRVERAGGLVLFESLAEKGVFYYAPTQARLATHDDGRPQFSLLRYVSNTPDGEREGEGGGIAHAVVELGVPESQVRRAEAELRSRVSGARIAAPVIFRSGRFGLVSSFQEDNGEFTRRVVGLGSAPVLDGSKAAVSLQLTKLGAKVLWQSFQAATPDVTFHFEMEVAGYRAPKRALIEADLERVYAHRSFNQAVATTYLQAEITEAYEELTDEGAIRLTQVGEDEQLEKLVSTAYSKLTELVFQPASAALGALPAGAEKGPSALDRASDLLEKRREEVREDQAAQAEVRSWVEEMGYDVEAFAAAFPGLIDDAGGDGDAPVPAAQQALPEFAAVSLYEMKKSRQRGTYRVDLNKYTADAQRLRFDENIGDLREHLDDPSVFRSVNLDDPLYRQRQVTAALLGVNASAFEDAIAYVTVQLRKEHAGGDTSVEELMIDREAFNQSGNRFTFTYGWKGDADRSAWNQYAWRSVWGFHGAPATELAWQTRSDGVIPLEPPFERKVVQLEVIDAQALAEAGVRSVAVKVTSQLGEREAVHQVTLNTARDERSGTIDFLVPRGATTYDYEIQWRLRGNRSLSTGPQQTDQDILYLDEIPEV